MKSNATTIISGPPGAGKSTIARRLATESLADRATDFYSYIQKGYMHPWLPEAQEQNIITIEAFKASAIRFALGGYETFVDGVVDPWFLNPWIQAVREGVNVHFIVLCPNEETTIARDIERKEPDALVNPDIIANMWQAFKDLDTYESHVIDTTNLSIEQAIIAVREAVKSGAMKLSDV